MFNENNKIKFLDQNISSETTRNGYVTMFQALAPYEEKYGDDVCTMDSRTISLVLDGITGTRLQGKLTRISLLRKYIKWCVAIGYQNASYNIDNVTLGTEKLKRRTIKSPEHLQQYLNAVFDPVSDNTVDNIYRVYMWLAYCGINEEDIFLVKTTDVDLEKLTIHYKSNNIPLYRQSAGAIERCVNNNSFVYNHPLYDATIKSRADGNTLVRGFKQTSAITARAYLARKNKQAIQNNQTDLELSYSRVWLSGLFYRMHEEELSTGKVDADNVFLLVMNNKEYELSGSENEATRKRRILKKYFDDYDLWKQIVSEGNDGR